MYCLYKWDKETKSVLKDNVCQKEEEQQKNKEGGRIWKINVHSADNILIETITVFDEKKSFAENGITGNDTTKYYTTLSSDVEIDYNSTPLYPKGNDPLIIYKKDV